MVRVRYSRLSANASTPVKATTGSAGYDLFSAYDYVVSSNTNRLISTDISVELPNGVYGRIAPRSGLALKNQINVMAGVIGK